MSTCFKKSQYVELSVTGGLGVNEFTFQPQTYLQGRRITSIEVYSGNDISGTRTGLTVVSVAQLKTCFLTLYCNDTNYPIKSVDSPKGTYTGDAFGEWFKLVPLWNFHRIANGTDPYVRDLFKTDGNLIVTWEKSTVITTNPALFVTGTTYAFLFNVGYE